MTANACPGRDRQCRCGIIPRNRRPHATHNQRGISHMAAILIRGLAFFALVIILWIVIFGGAS